VLALVCAPPLCGKLDLPIKMGCVEFVVVESLGGRPMVVAPGEDCTLRIGSGGRAENVSFVFVREKGRERECGELPVGRASETPEVILEGGALIVSTVAVAHRSRTENMPVESCYESS
jgi:hypothetical protein